MIFGIVIMVLVAISRYIFYIDSSNDKTIKTNYLVKDYDCDLLKTECSFSYGEHVVKFELSDNIRTMQPFQLFANLQNFTLPVENVVVSFKMKSMNMGINTFRLSRNQHDANQQNRWRVSILLPVCTSKRTDWLMNIKIEVKVTGEERRLYQVEIPLNIQ